MLSRMFQRGGADEGGADLVNLCATFGSDPFINSFAQVRATWQLVFDYAVGALRNLKHGEPHCDGSVVGVRAGAGVLLGGWEARLGC